MRHPEPLSIEKLFSQKNMQSIVDSIGSLINHNVVICNRAGVIIAATNRSRLGVYCEGIRKMLQNNEDMYVVTEEMESAQSFLPGVNQPLWYRGTAVGTLGITGNPNEVKVFCKVVRSFVQQQLLELDKEKSKANQRQMLSSFVYSWIFKAEGQDNAEFELRARSFGIDLRTPRVICVINYCLPASQNLTTDQKIQDILLYVEDYAESIDKQHIVSLIGQYVVLLLNTASTDRAKNLMTDLKGMLKQQLGADCAIGIGSTCRNQNEVNLSYESARLACNASRETTNHEIFVFELFNLELIISTVNRRYLQRVFNYVFRNYDDVISIEESINILQTYINSNRSIDQTAQTLCLHKNTVQYRLNKVYELTGYNPRYAWDLTFLHTVVLAYKMGIRKTYEML